MIPKYISLKEKINEDILKNIYPIGSKLPTELELASKYKVSRSTVRQALDLLVEQGIIEKRWGSGNTVISKSNSEKSNTVMVLMPNIRESENSDFIADLSSVLLKNGFQPEVHDTKNQYQVERDYLDSLLNDMYAGLIIHMCHSNLPSVNTDLLQQVLRRQHPVVFVNSAPSTIYNPIVVTLDHYQRGYLNARFLINKGFKHIGGIFINDSSSSVASFNGFMDAIRDANLNICDDFILWCNSKDPLGVNIRSTAGINRFLKYALDNVEAVYSDDHLLIGDGTFPVFTSTLVAAKSFGKECANTFLEIKKNGHGKSVTIQYKN